MPESMIEAGQANATHNHAGACIGTGGQGMIGGIPPPANAVSVGSQSMMVLPHVMSALAGIIEGPKKSIAAINIVLTILRMFICRPR